MSQRIIAGGAADQAQTANGHRDSCAGIGCRKGCGVSVGGQTDIGRIRIGEPARFTVDTYGDHEFTGVVTSIHPKAEIRDNVVDYVVVVRFAAPHGYVLRPEMTTTVSIDLDRHAHVLAVPIRAVRREGSHTFVLCRQDGRTEQQWVSTGIRDDSYWEIVAGLHEGEEVLIDGNLH